MRVLPVLLILTACAVPEPEGPTRAQQSLSRELAQRTAGPPQDCITPSSSRALSVIDSRTLTYDEGRTFWVNRLEGCPGLDPLDTLVVEVSSGRYCRNDRFRAVEPGSTIPGATCLLGEFVPYRR